MNRLDQIIADRGLAVTRSKAADSIRRGKVLVNGVITSKISRKVSSEDVITIDDISLLYVSRSALKLLFLLETIGINIKDFVCVDIGASTGGFTQVLLEKDVRKVYSVDIGHDQLSKNLLSNNKVINMEGTDSRNLTEDFFINIDLITVDVSFISLKKAMGNTLLLLKKNIVFMALIKPQFEVGRENIGSSGIVRDTDIAWRSVWDIRQWILEQGFYDINLFKSPLLGKTGNQEWLIYAKK